MKALEICAKAFVIICAMNIGCLLGMVLPIANALKYGRFKRASAITNEIYDLFGTDTQIADVVSDAALWLVNKRWYRNIKYVKKH